MVVDFSGRPGLEYHIPFTRARIGDFDVDLTREFFQGLVNHALITLHIDNLRGVNAHHQCETVFGLWPRPAHGHRGRPAHGRHRAVHQGRAVTSTIFRTASGRQN